MAVRFPAVKPHKYGAKTEVVDGIKFPSKAEAQRYSELRLLEKAGKISHLERQPKIPIYVHGEFICFYIADFHYFDKEKKEHITEEVKGFETPIWRLKKKLFHACYPDDKLIVICIGKRK